MTKTSPWQEYKLNDLGFVGRGKSKHRPRNDPILYGGDYPFVQTGDIKNATLHLTDYSQTYNEKGLSQSKLWEPETLCITIAANIAETAILGIKACFPDSIVGFNANPQKADVRFIKYYIDTIKLQMQSVSKGTTQDNLSLDKLLRFNFRVPPPTLQHKIASVISDYDYLIENNNSRIKILEEIAQAIYNEWFIKFRFPGHSNVRMIKSELGEIPERWEVKKIGDILTLEYGDALPSTKREKGNIPVYGSSGIIGYHNKYTVTAPAIVIGRAGNAGQVHWVDDNFFPVDSTFYVAPKGNANLYYLYYCFNSAQLEKLVSGVAVPGINRNTIYAKTIITCPDNISTIFESSIKPIFQEKHILRKKNIILRQTRDILLPRLISGELNVENLNIKVDN